MIIVDSNLFVYLFLIDKFMSNACLPQVPDYYDIIARPMDLSTMMSKVDLNRFKDVSFTTDFCLYEVALELKPFDVISMLFRGRTVKINDRQQREWTTFVKLKSIYYFVIIVDVAIVVLFLAGTSAPGNSWTTSTWYTTMPSSTTPSEIPRVGRVLATP